MATGSIKRMNAKLFAEITSIERLTSSSEKSEPHNSSKIIIKCLYNYRFVPKWLVFEPKSFNGVLSFKAPAQFRLNIYWFGSRFGVVIWYL